MIFRLALARSSSPPLGASRLLRGRVRQPRSTCDASGTRVKVAAERCLLAGVEDPATNFRGDYSPAAERCEWTRPLAAHRRAQTRLLARIRSLCSSLPGWGAWGATGARPIRRRPGARCSGTAEALGAPGEVLPAQARPWTRGRRARPGPSGIMAAADVAPTLLGAEDEPLLPTQNAGGGRPARKVGVRTKGWIVSRQRAHGRRPMWSLQDRGE